MIKSISMTIALAFITVPAFVKSQTAAPKKAATPSPAKETMVLISTNMGDMKVKLYNETPQHRDNFIKLVKAGFYDDLLFHRVIRGFMIQGGDPESKNAPQSKGLGNGGPGYTIPAEFNPALFHKKGALAAARQGDNVNPKKESSGSQFYIVHGGGPMLEENINTSEKRSGMKFSDAQRKAYSTIGGTPFLDGQYTVFGEVVEGLDVIDKIAATQTGVADRPLTDMKMKMTILK